MSTYTGDTTITNVLTVSASRTTSSGTTVAYTVPAGRFAEVQLRSAGSSGAIGGGSWSASVSIGPASFAGGNNVIGGTGESVRDFPDLIILNEGESVSVTLSVFTTIESVSVSATVVEKNKP